MTDTDKQALVIPQRKNRRWVQSVMRDCDFCHQWALTVKHDDGGCICASCCDAEYTTALTVALEMAMERAEAAKKRVAELEESHAQVIQARDFYKRANEAAMKSTAKLDSRAVTLPRPACTYADHSYPAYSEKQVIDLLKSAGINLETGGE
ncbi:hypothetical protein ACM92K_003154 [Cronobacter turicensis]